MDTTINIIMSRDTDTLCMKNRHSIKIFMNESKSSEAFSCTGGYQLTYSSKGLAQKLADPSISKSAPFLCIDWRLNAAEQSTMNGVIEERFNFTGYDVYYSGSNREFSSSTVDIQPSYHSEIRVPSSKHVKLSEASFKNVIPDDCELFFNSTNGNMDFVSNDVDLIAVVSKQEDAVKGKIVINNKTIDKNSCIRFENIPTHTPDVAENARPISKMFVLFICIVCVVIFLLCLLVAVRNRSCSYVTRHGRCLPEVPAYV
ncbi:hypothetical protein ACJMK2_032260 [Sinanodonta woodiana]|uniref:Uncharacterized protein n=1 Tax=Sinanodonta woodiana TaxID=1069815 RepID=A0ABD3X589_SINWO